MAHTQTTTVTATGDAVSGGCTLLGIHYQSGGTDGQIVLEDGSGGEEKLDLPTAGNNTDEDVTIPGEGIKFDSALHVATLTNVASVTFFYVD